MFRRADYQRVGGYRSAFRLAQDWDLWLRLGELGTYFEVPETLYVQRLSANSLSFRRLPLQRRYGDLAARAARARLEQRSDEVIIAEATALADASTKLCPPAACAGLAPSPPTTSAQPCCAVATRARAATSAGGVSRPAARKGLDPLCSVVSGAGSRAVSGSAALSIVVPTYGRESVLIETLHRLQALDPPADEILVVDQTVDHEDATSRDLERLARRGAIRWLRRDEASIPGAMNEGLREAIGERILFVDDDVEPDTSLVGAHLNAAERQGEPVIVAGQVLQPGQTAEPSPRAASFDSTRLWNRK